MINLFSIYLIRFVTVFFLIGISISIYFFPGGNIYDLNQIGYSFTLNFLSDLGAYQTRSGSHNFLSSFFFSFSLFLFSFAGFGFLMISRLFCDNKINYILAVIGSIFFFSGSIFFAATGLTPHDLYFDEHIFFANNAFRLLIPASFFYIILLFKSNINNNYAYVLLFFLLSIFVYVLYEIFNGNPFDSVEELVRQVVMQKIIVFISVLSMFFITFAFSSKNSGD